MGESSLIELSASFIADLLPSILAVQCPQIVTTEIYTQTLEPAGSFLIQAVNTPGTYDPSEMLPVFNALSYSLKPNSRATRPAGKRYAGIPETAQQDGVITLGAYLTRMETLRLALSEPLGNDPSFYYPVIVKRIKEEVPDTEPQQYTYRLPETDLELVTNQIFTVTNNFRISHQVSRGN